MRTFTCIHLHPATWLAALVLTLVACSGPAVERGPATPKAVVSEAPGTAAPGAPAPEQQVTEAGPEQGLAMGYVRIGTSVPLRGGEPVPGDGCPRGWYEVAPRGHICLSDRTTLDLEDPYFKAKEAIQATDPIPAFFEGGKRHVGGGGRDRWRLIWRVIPNGSMVAYHKAFES